MPFSSVVGFAIAGAIPIGNRIAGSGGGGGGGGGSAHVPFDGDMTGWMDDFSGGLNS